MISKLDLKLKMLEIKGKHCTLIDVEKVNDQIIRMSYMDGEYQ